MGSAAITAGNRFRVIFSSFCLLTSCPHSQGVTKSFTWRIVRLCSYFRNFRFIAQVNISGNPRASCTISSQFLSINVWVIKYYKMYFSIVRQNCTEFFHKKLNNSHSNMIRTDFKILAWSTFTSKCSLFFSIV